MSERERQSVHVEETDVQSGFLCDEPELTRFFLEQALKFEKSGFARTYVVRRDADDPADFPPVLGYYTICMARVNTAELPEKIGTLEPNSPPALPAALLGRMARDQRVPRGLQLGEWLVGHSARRSVCSLDALGTRCRHRHRIYRLLLQMARGILLNQLA